MQSKRIVLSVVTGASLVVLASNPSLADRPETPATKAQDQQPAAQSLSMQSVMQDTGGSLLQASEPQSTSNTDSAFQVDPKTSYSLYAVPEPKPRVLKKHDLVNIVVREVSNSISTGNADLERKSDLDAKTDSFARINFNNLAVQTTGANNPEIKLEASRDFKGTASVDRSDTVTLRLEAEVIDVKPNGNLVIQAKKHIKTDEEEQFIVLTGTCRVLDVDATNSVLSTDLHDLDVKKNTTGAVTANGKRGIVHRILDFVNPF